MLPALGRERRAGRCVRELQPLARAARARRGRRDPPDVSHGLGGHDPPVLRGEDHRRRPPAARGCTCKEFSAQSDWMHHGEGLQLFNRMALSAPNLPAYRERARRFAAFYMGTDPDAPNYDPEKKLIRSMINGSRGPLLRKATALDWVGDPVRHDRVRRAPRREHLRAVPRALPRIHRRRRRPLPQPGRDDAADQCVSAHGRGDVSPLARRLHGRVAGAHAGRTTASSRASSISTARSAAPDGGGGETPTGGASARSTR